MLDFGRFPMHPGGGLTHPINSALSVKCSMPAYATAFYCITLTPQRMLSPNINATVLLDNRNDFYIIDFVNDNGDRWGNPQMGNYWNGGPQLGLAGSSKHASINPQFSIDLNPEGLDVGLHQNRFLIRLYYNYTNTNIADPQQLCAAAPPQGTLAAPDQYMTVQATAERSCQFYAVGGVNFGKYYSLDKVRDQTGLIHVNCTQDITFRVGISSGRNGQNGKRAMRCQTPETCGQSLIYYDIYRDPRYSSGGIWGDDWNNAGSIIKDTVAWYSSFDYSPPVRIYPGQTTPPVGVYQDTVIITIRTDMD